MSGGKGYFLSIFSHCKLICADCREKYCAVGCKLGLINVINALPVISAEEKCTACKECEEFCPWQPALIKVTPRSGLERVLSYK